jgi:hypothetical protein
MTENKDNTAKIAIFTSLIIAATTIIVAFINGNYQLEAVRQAQATSAVLSIASTQDIATKSALQAIVSAPTDTPYPTFTPLSTYTPRPTYTPQATYTVPPIPISTSTPSVTLPFADNFDSGARLEWKQFGGKWIMTNGEITLGNVNGLKKSVILVGDKNWSDYTVSIKINHHGVQENYSYVIVRAQDERNFIALKFVHYRVLEHSAIWYIVQDGNWTKVPNTYYADWPLDRQIEVKVVVKGDIIMSYVDGNQTSLFSGLPYTNGIVGFGAETVVSDQTVTFDDFLVEP